MLAFQHEVFGELLVYTQLSPFDPSPLLDGLKQTHRLLTVEEGTRSLGWGAEVIASALEALGPGLHAGRVASRDLPIPAARTLEAAVLPVRRRDRRRGAGPAALIRPPVRIARLEVGRPC